MSEVVRYSKIQDPNEYSDCKIFDLPLKINLGSGQRKFGRGWINVDSQGKWDPDIVADGASLRDHFSDSSAEYIVLHQVLEHFGCGEAQSLITECNRILQPSGSLIVTVPDMNTVVRMWQTRRISTQVFMTNVYGAYMESEEDRHKWGYVGVTLREHLLACAPWKRVMSFDFRSIEGADIAQAEWILGMEAVK